MFGVRLIEPQAMESWRQAHIAMEHLTSNGQDVFLLERKDNRHVFVITREHNPAVILAMPDYQLVSFTAARGVKVLDRHWHEAGNA